MTFWQRTKEAVAPAARKLGFLSRPARVEQAPYGARLLQEAIGQAVRAAPAGSLAMDSADSYSANYAMGDIRISDALLGWYMSQGFIGYQVCAFLSTHWLIDKACTMPANDAIRKGYAIVSDDGDQLPDDLVKRMRRADERFKIADHMRDFIGTGRKFGIRLALFKVNSNDPKYYEVPFNPDGVTPRSYEGIVQVDPQWTGPDLQGASVTDPTDINFYEPTFWLVNGRRIHRSHFVIFRTCEVPDILKPIYRYGGVPVPQRIMERVYCAERTANEAPELAMTKRLTTYGTNAEEALANPEGLQESLRRFAAYRNNYGVKTYDKESEEIGQMDTSLADLDAVIMSQYQLVAAAANVPATKLLGTTPKGFNSTGEYEERSYHEELETIQHQLSPLLERHHMLVMRSEIAPSLEGGKPVGTSVVWEPLDSPTSKEVAETQKLLADRDAVLAGIGAIDGIDARNRVRADLDSGYFGIPEAERGGEEDPAVAE